MKKEHEMELKKQELNTVNELNRIKKEHEKVHSEKQTFLCKLKDDICYLYSVVSNINKKIDSMSSDSYSSVYNRSIDLNSLIPLNAGSLYSDLRKVFYIKNNLSYVPGNGIIFSHNSGKYFIGTILQYNKNTGNY